MGLHRNVFQIFYVFVLHTTQYPRAQDIYDCYCFKLVFFIWVKIIIFLQSIRTISNKLKYKIYLYWSSKIKFKKETDFK